MSKELKTLLELSRDATPGEWRVREAKHSPDEFYLHAPSYEGHPYHGVASGIQILSDEDYPTKRADADFIAALVNEYRLIHSTAWPPSLEKS